MALIKLGAFITQISGKVGGQSFATGRGGSYIKNIGTYSTRSNELTSAKLANFSYLSQQWHKLTQLQRDGWASAAKDFPYTNRVGESKIYSGYILFIKFNGSLVQLNQSINFDAPVKIDLVPITGWYIDIVGSDYSLINETLDSNTFAILKSSSAVQQSVGPKTINYVQIFGAQIDNLGIQIDILFWLTNKFRTLQSGSRYYLQLDLVSVGSGQRLNNVFQGYIDYNIV